MRGVFPILVFAGLLSGGAGHGALDIVPTSLNVVMSDSVSNPDQDSVTISLVVSVKGGSTMPQPRWDAAQISIEGAVRMNGIVDSGQVLAANLGYTWKIGAWVDKKPFSVVGFTDPEGVLGETPADAENNAIVRIYKFRPTVKLDTVYTGPACRTPAPGGK